MITYPLLEALIHRRSRRFAKGMKVPGGPLSYASAKPPESLTLDGNFFILWFRPPLEDSGITPSVSIIWVCQARRSFGVHVKKMS